MNKELLNQVLFTETPNEKEYKKHKNSVSKRFSELGTTNVNGKDVYCIHTSGLQASPIFLRKDSRYSFMPLHTYDSLNINYIYSGQCTYHIDNTEVTLKKGDVCIFDTGVLRTKVSSSYEDIVINIAVQNSYFQKTLNFSDNKNLITSFVYSALSKNSEHDNYIIFRTKENPEIMDLFSNLIAEYFYNRKYKNEIIQNYLSIIVIKLLSMYQANGEEHTVQFSNKLSHNLFYLVHYIEVHSDTCTLDDLSREFGYHKKYICNLLKKNYGKTFKEIQKDSRLSKAVALLTNTNISVNEICSIVGFSNQNNFYAFFREKYGVTPNKYRTSSGEFETGVS